MKKIFLLTIVILLTLTGCGEQIPVQSTKEIIATIESKIGTQSNRLPDDLVEIQFEHFQLPDSNSAEIQQHFAFKNVTDETLLMRVWPYYNQKLNDYIYAKEGAIAGERPGDPLPVIEVVPGARYVFHNDSALLELFSEYEADVMEKIFEWSADILVQMEIDGKKYYFKMDLANAKVEY